MTDRAEGHDVHYELCHGVRCPCWLEGKAEFDAELQRLRDRWVPCEPCQQGRHDDCTGDCTSNCCALAYSEERVDELEKAARDVVKESASWVNWHENRPLPHLSSYSDPMYAALVRLREMVE